jgi:hypothetical protein
MIKINLREVRLSNLIKHKRCNIFKLIPSISNRYLKRGAESQLYVADCGKYSYFFRYTLLLKKLNREISHGFKVMTMTLRRPTCFILDRYMIKLTLKLLREYVECAKWFNLMLMCMLIIHIVLIMVYYYFRKRMRHYPVNYRLPMLSFILYSQSVHNTILRLYIYFYCCVLIYTK